MFFRWGRARVVPHEPAGYLRVRDWRDHQHYTGRNPPWIKLHTNLLENTEFFDLADHLKVQLICLWLVAARYENQVPNRLEWLERFNLSRKKLDVNSLVQAGFLSWGADESPANDDASELLAERLQDDSEALAPIRARPRSASASRSSLLGRGSAEGEVRAVYDYWRETLGKTDARYDRILPERREKITARLEDFSVDDLKRAIDGVAMDSWEDRPKHNDITKIFRNSSQVEKFLEITENTAALPRDERIRRHLQSLKERGLA